jgi:ornithine cyclodeaminase/alanine dehydrogenase-like protein (mu-crystallin family)
VIVLTDEDVRARLRPADAVAAVREALAGQREGRLFAPARLRADLGAGSMVVTAGRLAGTGYGFRAYDTFGAGEQLTVVWDDDGTLVGAVAGSFLGAARTGAIGAVAVDLLAAPAAASLGVVGTGRQAYAQLWAIRAVRALREVRVYGRDAGRRAGFADRCRAELGLPAVAAASAEEAVSGAEIVLLATDSPTPVIEAGWVRPDAHVTTLGPKTVGRHECPVELAARADTLVTDSLAQVDAYPEPFFLDGSGHLERLTALADVLADGSVTGSVTGPATGLATGPATGRMTMFCSVGLAGTEVAVAARLLRS